MGYCSCFSLSAKPMTQELYQKIDAELQLYTCYFEQDGIENGVGHWCNQDDTWYSCRADMIQLSRTFPDVYFQLYVEGEDHNDDWRAFFKDGRYQENYAERVYEPLIPDEFIDGDASEEVQEDEDIIRAERQKRLPDSSLSLPSRHSGQRRKRVPLGFKTHRCGENCVRGFLDGEGVSCAFTGTTVQRWTSVCSGNGQRERGYPRILMGADDYEREEA